MGDIGSYKDIASLISTVLALCALFYTWLTSRSKDNATQLASMNKKVVDHNSRIERIENELHHLPQKDDLADLRLALVQLEGTVKQHAAISNGTAQTVQRLDEFLRRDVK